VRYLSEKQTKRTEE